MHPSTLWVGVGTLIGALLAGCGTSYQHCPVCGGPVTPIDQVKDDTSKPSRNLDVWNRSSCGNLLFGPGSFICLRDGYAYSATTNDWGLSLEDPQGFALELATQVRRFPLPVKSAIRSLVVYSQKISGDRVEHSVGFWCDTDRRYLQKVEGYGKSAGLTVEIQRDRIPGQTYVSAHVETQREQGGKGVADSG